jgi:hypothetical protein
MYRMSDSVGYAIRHNTQKLLSICLTIPWNVSYPCITSLHEYNFFYLFYAMYGRTKLSGCEMSMDSSIFVQLVNCAHQWKAF